MGKMLKNYTLGEVKRICKAHDASKDNKDGHNCCECPIYNRDVGYCVVLDSIPDIWRFWSSSSVDDAQALQRVFPAADTVRRTENELLIHTPDGEQMVSAELLPELQIGETATLAEIVDMDE